MEFPTEFVNIKQEYSEIEIKQEEVSFELIEDHYLEDDTEENVINCEIKVENDKLSESEDFDEIGSIKEIKCKEEEMSYDWDESAVNEPDPLALFPVTQTKVEPQDIEEEEHTITADTHPSTSQGIDVAFLCTKCGSMFTGYFEQRRHINSCSQSRKSMERRSRPNKSTKCYPLQYCLKKHMQFDNEDNFYRCTQCEYVSKIQCVHRRHMKIHSENKLNKCTVCNYATKINNDLKNHIIRTHTNEKPYKCTECDYAAKIQHDVRMHMKIHSVEKPFKCTECNYSTKRNSDLKVHVIRAHTEEKRYKCTECDYASKIQLDLKRHMLLHPGEKPHKCTLCNYATTLMHSLKCHMLMHTGEKPFKCKECHYASSRRYDLKKHMVVHTRKMPCKSTVW